MFRFSLKDIHGQDMSVVGVFLIFFIILLIFQFMSVNKFLKNLKSKNNRMRNVFLYFIILDAIALGCGWVLDNYVMPWNDYVTITLKAIIIVFVFVYTFIGVISVVYGLVVTRIFRLRKRCKGIFHRG